MAVFNKMVCLQLSGNRIKNMSIFGGEEVNFPNLRRLDLSTNKIGELVGLNCPKLQFLDLTGNKLDKYEGWTGHPTLKELYIGESKIKTLALGEMPELEIFSAPKTGINAFSGYEGFNNVIEMDLENTKIDKVEEEAPEMTRLKKLNLCGTKISNMDNLKHVFKFETLRELNILETPLETHASSFNMLLAEVLILFPALENWCEREITEKHRYEGLYVAKYRWEKKREAEKKKAEEQRLKEEEEAAKE